MGTAIRNDESYTIEDFKRLTGLGTNAVRMAEMQGLVCSWVGSRKFVRGEAWNRYLESQAGKPAPSRAQRSKL